MTYLHPTGNNLEGGDLTDFLQSIVVGITGLAGKRVRPRWQAEPANIPSDGTSWASIGVTSTKSDTFPFVGQTINGAELQRHEEFDLDCSFYDLGDNGEADQYASLLRDGLAIPENRQPLLDNNMGLIEVGDLITVPSLLKERWLYRVDVKIRIRQEINRVYQVPSVETVTGTLYTSDGRQRKI